MPTKISSVRVGNGRVMGNELSSPAPAADAFGRPLFVDGTYPKGRPVCASVFDLALATSDDSAFLGALLEDNGLLGGPWGDEMEAMSRDVRMLRLTDVQRFEMRRPLDFARHEWFAAYAVDYARWLEEIGARENAVYVRELLALYPGRVPFAEERERDAHRKTLEAANPGLTAEIRARYPSLDRDLAAALRRLLQERGPAIARDCDEVRTRFAVPMPPTLGEILDAPSSDADFAQALLAWLDAPQGNPPLGFDDQPEVGRMLWVLESLVTSLRVSGLEHFLLSHGVGRYFPKLGAWAKAVGAETTVAYAKAATARLKALSGGKLPPMGDAKRIEAIGALERQDEAAGGKGLFFELDEQYATLVAPELEQRVRAYVRAHRDDIERELLTASAAIQA